MVEIGDDAFLNALIEMGVDTDGDGQISTLEAEEITSLNVSRNGISDMSGLDAFINLERLICFENNLTSLDISKNTALE